MTFHLENLHKTMASLLVDMDKTTLASYMDCMSKMGHNTTAFYLEGMDNPTMTSCLVNMGSSMSMFHLEITDISTITLLLEHPYSLTLAFHTENMDRVLRVFRLEHMNNHPKA